MGSVTSMVATVGSINTPGGVANQGRSAEEILNFGSFKARNMAEWKASGGGVLASTGLKCPAFVASPLAYSRTSLGTAQSFARFFFVGSFNTACDGSLDTDVDRPRYAVEYYAAGMAIIIVGVNEEEGADSNGALMARSREQ